MTKKKTATPAHQSADPAHEAAGQPKTHTTGKQTKAPVAEPKMPSTKGKAATPRRVARLGSYLTNNVVVNKGSKVMGDRILGVIITGMIGMILAAILFFSGQTPYGEIQLTNKVLLVDTLLSHRISSLNGSVTAFGKRKAYLIRKDSLKKLKDSIATAKRTNHSTGLTITAAVVPPNDSLKEYQKKIDQALLLIKKTQREKLALDSGNADTSMAYFSHYFFVNRHAFLDSLSDLNWPQNDEKMIRMSTADTCKTFHNPLPPIQTRLILQKQKRRNMEFFSEYPQFGLWIIFSIAQMVLWAMIVPLIIAKVKSLNVLLGGVSSRISYDAIFSNAVVPGVLLIAFVIIFYFFMIDRKVITDNYFLNFYTVRTFIFTTLGYAVASFCFGIFITLSKSLDSLDESIKTQEDFTKIAIGKGAEGKFMIKYLALKAAFDNSFICSALILSFSVLWMGVLVSAINGTEAFRFYFYLAGKNVLPNDFVYLMGLMNTLILLIFYVPVKLKFSSLAISQLSDAPTTLGSSPGAGNVTSTSIFSGLSDTLGPLLITSSPLLASLVHTIFGTFVKN